MDRSLHTGNRLTLNVLLSLIIQAKKQGKGKLGNGRLLVALLKVIADKMPEHSSRERSVIACFCDEPVKSVAYQKIDKKLVKYFKYGRPYPFEKLHFTRFEAALNNRNLYAEYLTEMDSVFESIVDLEKTEQIVYTVFSILRHDESISHVLYGMQFISKNRLIDDSTSRKQIYAPALVFGLLYQLHKTPDFSSQIDLKAPDILPNFYLAHLKTPIISEKLDELLHPELEMPVIQQLMDAAKRNAKYNSVCTAKRIELRCRHRYIKDLPEAGNICLFGISGSGKTEYLRNYRDKQSIILFISLSNLKAKSVPEFDPLHSSAILLQILLNYVYRTPIFAVSTIQMNEKTAHIRSQMTTLDTSFSTVPIEQKPEFTLILDSLHDAAIGQHTALLNEIRYLADKWKNVRFLISNRTPIGEAVLPGFLSVECCGYDDDTLRELMPEGYPEQLHDLLKNTRIFSIYQDQRQFCAPTRAALLDGYIYPDSAHISHSTDMLERFLIRLALPYAAFEAVHNAKSMITRADFSASIGRAISLYFRNERVYQNYTAPLNIKKELLPAGSRTDEWIDFVLSSLCYLIPDLNCPHLIRFSHPIYREFFAAKHIQNLYAAFDAAYTNCESKGFQAEFHRQHFGEIWFPPEEKPIYALVGELAGDDLNKPCDGFIYKHTFLDDFLDWSREFDTFRLTENVMRTMAAARENVICGADFSETMLPLWIPAAYKFSNRGKDPCRFWECKGGMIGIIDGNCHLIRTDHEAIVTLIWQDGYAIDFDLQHDAVTAEYDVDVDEIGLPDAQPDAILLRRVYAKLPQFRGCDFSGARFLTEESEKWMPVLNEYF